MKNFVALICAVLIIGCTTTKIGTSKSSQTSLLSQTSAQKRSNQVSQPKYKLNFDLDNENSTFSGTTIISFNFTKIGEDLRVDFDKGKIQSLKVNGKRSKYEYNDSYILLSEKDFTDGKNTIQISFTKEYSRDGAGLYRFKDQEDGKVYIYSDLEPYNANKIFPCFDQPDLKATYHTIVNAPKNWEVISSTIPKTKLINKTTAQWDFGESALFSTYIWSLHAGPYAKFEDKTAKYPSRFFIRQSLKKYINIKDWKIFTRQGFEFFDEYFGYPYPYKKYDQIIVPDFNAGAMENVAAVTFSERFISRGEKTQAARRRLANVIYHEMAHMWFGNLVTMKWWNDLWLNESFATYLAFLGVSRNTEFKEVSWSDFSRTKEWAYWEDQLVTTHPIEATIADTSQAFANFDGITYGKGAASLKQIHYYLGEESFKSGLQHYFKTYANTNTELKDFISSLGKGAGKNLIPWQKKWLQTSGLNFISVDYQCNKGVISNIIVNQSTENQQPIRPHAFKIGFLNNKNNRLRVYHTEKVQLNNKSQILTNSIGKKCPSYVYPNFEDHGYFMVKLDGQSIQSLESKIHSISDSNLRQLSWNTLWNMVYYGKYSYKKYLDLASKSGLENENNPSIIRGVLTSLHGRYSNSPSILFFIENDSTLKPEEKLELRYNLSQKVWTLLSNAKPGSELQKFYFSSFLNFASHNFHLNKLASILEGKLKLKGLLLDQDKRWRILQILNQYNYKGSDKLISEESNIDKSSFGKKMLLAIEASKPNWKTKEKWLKEFKNKKSTYSYAEIKSALYNLFPLEQKSMRKKYSEGFFDDLIYMNKHMSNSMAATFASLAPNDCSISTIQMLEKFMNKKHDLKPTVEKKMKVNLQEAKRCFKVISFNN